MGRCHQIEIVTGSESPVKSARISFCTLQSRADMTLSVIGCYALAWRSFSKWWIPLCVISGLVVIFQIAPRVLVKSDLDSFETTTQRLVSAALASRVTSRSEKPR